MTEWEKYLQQQQMQQQQAAQGGQPPYAAPAQAAPSAPPARQQAAQQYMQTGYVPGQQVAQAQQNYQTQQAAKPGAYQSQYDGQIASAFEKIMGRGKFEYDMQGDPVYQQMKDKYIQQGQTGMMDTMGQAQAMTGGYGNSYAQSVGQQTYDKHLSALNDNVGELRRDAANDYRQEGQDMYQQVGLMQGLDDRDYGRNRDAVSDWMNQTQMARADYQDERNYDRGAYESDRGFNRGAFESDRGFDRGVYESDRGFDYGVGRDQVADSRYADETQYNRGRDTSADAYRDKTFDYGVSRDQSADQYRDKVFDYGVGRDAVGDQRYDAETAYGKDRDILGDAYRDKVFDYGAGRDQVGDQRYDDQTAYGKERDAAADQYRDKTFDYGVGRDAIGDQRYDESTAYNQGRDAIGDQRYNAEQARNTVMGLLTGGTMPSEDMLLAAGVDKTTAQQIKDLPANQPPVKKGSAAKPVTFTSSMFNQAMTYYQDSPRAAASYIQTLGLSAAELTKAQQLLDATAPKQTPQYQVQISPDFKVLR